MSRCTEWGEMIDERKGVRHNADFEVEQSLSTCHSSLLLTEMRQTYQKTVRELMEVSKHLKRQEGTLSHLEYIPTGSSL